VRETSYNNNGSHEAESNAATMTLRNEGT